MYKKRIKKTLDKVAIQWYYIIVQEKGMKAYQTNLKKFQKVLTDSNQHGIITHVR